MVETLINMAKADAMAFVEDLQGGWDAVVWDPPYMDKKTVGKTKKTVDNSLYDFWVDIPERTIEDPVYNKKVLELIHERTSSFAILKFYFERMKSPDPNLIIGWYKGGAGYAGGYSGAKVKKNTEYVNIYYNNFAPSLKHTIEETIYIPRLVGFGKTYKWKRFEKPVKLYKDIFTYLDCKYVLDPFAGTYNSVEACKTLGIRIDACDKYEKPPEAFNLENYFPDDVETHGPIVKKGKGLTRWF